MKNKKTKLNERSAVRFSALFSKQDLDIMKGYNDFIKGMVEKLREPVFYSEDGYETYYDPTLPEPLSANDALRESARPRLYRYIIQDLLNDLGIEPDESLFACPDSSEVQRISNRLLGSSLIIEPRHTSLLETRESEIALAFHGKLGFLNDSFRENV